MNDLKNGGISYDTELNSTFRFVIFLAIIALIFILIMVTSASASPNITNTVFDDSGNGLVANVTYAKYNATSQSYEFNGATSYITPNVQTWNGSFTASVWVYTKVNDTVERYSIHGRKTINRWYIRNSEKVVVFGVYNSSFTQAIAQNNTNNPEMFGQWRNIIGTFNTTNKELKVYVDGAYRINSTMTGNEITDFRLDDIGDLSATFYNGAIDEVRIYNKTLSNDEATELFNDGRTKNTSIFPTSLIQYYSFDDPGVLQVSGTDTLNLSYLASTVNDSNKISNSSNNYTLYAQLNITTGNSAFNIYNENLRIISNSKFYGGINGFSTGQVNITNATISSWDDDLNTYDNNISRMTSRGRANIYFKNTPLFVAYSNISYLGMDDSQQHWGLVCDNCDSALVTNSIFNFNLKGVEFGLGSDRITFSNNLVYNNSGNGTASTSGVTIYSSDHGRIYNNTFYNIGKPIGWTGDDSPAIIITSNSLIDSTNFSIFNNIIHNGETGISTFSSSNQAEVTHTLIQNNTIYSMLGSGIKFEATNHNNVIDGNTITGCGSTGLNGYYRPAIELDTVHPENDSFNITVSNNKIADCAKGITALTFQNLTIINNIIYNTTNIATGFLGFPADSGGSITNFGAISAVGCRNVTLVNNTIGNTHNLYALGFGNSNDTFIDNSFYGFSVKATLSNQNLNLTNFTNPLIYFSNLSAYCANVFTCGGNSNLNVVKNTQAYVLDNYIINEGVHRDFNPIWYSSSNSTLKNITSNLTNTVNVPVSFSADSCSISKITYVSVTGAYQNTDNPFYCSNSVVTANITGIEPGNAGNILTIVYSAPVIPSSQSGGGGGSPVTNYSNTSNYSSNSTTLCNASLQTRYFFEYGIPFVHLNIGEVSCGFVGYLKYVFKIERFTSTYILVGIKLWWLIILTSSIIIYKVRK